MPLHPLAGKPAPPELLIDVARLERDYYARIPDPADPRFHVSFGTSGHRGSPFDGTFRESHILAITQAICDYRRLTGIAGPLYLGRDTHGASPAAQRTALEVLAANGVETFIARGDAATPTPVVSRAILAWNRAGRGSLADGIVITPSHNPPGDGGIKYNPPDGGPADTEVTSQIQTRANQLLRAGERGIRRMLYEKASRSPCVHQEDYVGSYVTALQEVLDMEAIRSSGLRLGVDPLGGSALDYWGAIARRFDLDVTVVNPSVDPTFAFMSVDHDGKIRMDCSSPCAMAGLVRLKDDFDVAFGNDPDADRHGIVTRTSGLMNPNHFLATAIAYLLEHRPGWQESAVVGKTLVSSGLIDRVVAQAGRRLYEVPVGFKWFAPRLFDGSCCFGGEESAGASFLRRDGTAWTTDKDGILLCLLAAEMTARTGKDPGEHYRELSGHLGAPHYTRIDSPATPAQKNALKKLSPENVTATHLGGETILQKLTNAPGNGAPIGGIKVSALSGWFAARPSGTEDVVKLYAESFKDESHLQLILDEARAILEKFAR
ncbi:MAG: phosphoglucomutase (alpha-D-glucose-1,6-bisphosphate-dependent) [Acidobacteria bacterium]|nr:phosphoglucomutase (alpha-D-glucose-1,6-bisphosphate-dependent) [Acidobacteriota bacterium]